MTEIMDFWEFLLPQLAEFLLTEPIIYFVGLAVLLWVVYVVRRIIY